MHEHYADWCPHTVENLFCQELAGCEGCEVYQRSKVKRLVITDNAEEKLEIAWDGERFALVQTTKNCFPNIPNERVIMLNPAEGSKASSFIMNCLSVEKLTVELGLGSRG